MNANSNIILSKEKRDLMISEVEEKFREILEIFQFDVENDQQIRDTPKRWSKMMVNELLSGCYTEEPQITVFKNQKNYDEIIFLGSIKIKSLCSHHFKSFIGDCFIAYIPDEKICGISKLSRIVQWFMKRPQIQEELTKQIADYIQQKLSPKGCAVYIQAKHLCMLVRGVEEYNSNMTTSSFTGCFQNENFKNEFMNLVKLNSFGKK